jgi:hypothetical protein
MQLDKQNVWTDGHRTGKVANANNCMKTEAVQRQRQKQIQIQMKGSLNENSDKFHEKLTRCDHCKVPVPDVLI